MKLRTSYCKLTTFKKDLTRFAPLWALYLVGVLLVFSEMGGYSTYDRFAWSSMDDIVMSFGIVNICYAGVCALVLFGDLYNTRMCYSLHTQPARRESLFLSHAAAALLFSLVPNLMALPFMFDELGAYWFLGLYWLLASTLQFVFYFGLAAVSAMCVGNWVGMIAVYAVLNFFSMIAYWVVDTIYLPMMTGVEMNFAGFSLLCPTVELWSHDFFIFERVETWLETTSEWGTFYQYTGLGDGWGYMAVLGAIGIGMLGVAVLLYRLRHLESAGDFVAFRKLSPVVCVVITVCVAVGFAFLGDAMGSGYMLWLAVGAVVGFFGGRMLIERRVRVFRPRVIAAFGILVAVAVGSFLVVQSDMLGIVRYVPEADKVASVTISNYKNTGNYYSDDYYYGNRITVKLEEPQQIDDVIAAHRDILDRMHYDHTSLHRVTIRYELTSGRTVVRSYTAPAYGTNYDIFRKYFYTPEQILGYTDWDSYVRNMDHLSVEGVEIREDCYEEFLRALRADCENGAVSFDGKTDDTQFWVYLRTETPEGIIISRDLSVSSQAENTIALLKTAKFLLGYDEVSDDLYINYMSVDGEDVPAQGRLELLEALLKDQQNGNLRFNDGQGEYYIEYYIQLEGMDLYRYILVDKDAENTIAWIKGE